LDPTLEDDETGVGESDGVGVGVGVAVGVCVGDAVGDGVAVTAGEGVGVVPDPAVLVGEASTEGQSSAADVCVNGRAEGTVTGLWLACAPDALAVPELLPAVPPVPDVLVDVGQGPGLDVLPDRPPRGRLPGPLVPASPDAPDARRPTVAEVLSPPEPPLPVIAGWTSPLPPFSTVELTWTSAARSGGTATAAAVIEAAAARPATSRIHPMPCGRRVVQNEAAQRAPDVAAAWPTVTPVRATPCSRRLARNETAQSSLDAASQMPAGQVRVARITRAAHRAAWWPCQ